MKEEQRAGSSAKLWLDGLSYVTNVRLRVEVLGADEAKSRQFVSQSGLITGSIYDSSRLQKAFVSESDGFEAMEDSVMRTINEADSTVDFKVDLRSCASVSHR